MAVLVTFLSLWLNADRRLKYSRHLFWFTVPGGAVHLGGDVWQLECEAAGHIT